MGIGNSLGTPHRHPRRPSHAQNLKTLDSYGHPEIPSIQLGPHSPSGPESATIAKLALEIESVLTLGGHLSKLKRVPGPTGVARLGLRLVSLLR